MQQVLQLRQRLRIAGVVVAAAFLGVFWVIFENTREVESMNASVAHTQSVLRIIARVRLERSQVSNDLWAYRATRDARFSVNVAWAMQSLHRDIETLQALTADNAEQQKLLAQIAPLLTEQIAHLETMIGPEQGGEPGAVDAEQLPFASAALHLWCDRLESNERRTLESRSMRLRASSRTMVFEILCGGLFMQLVLGLAAHLVHRQLLMRVELERSLRRARESLGMKYQERGQELHYAIENLQAEVKARREAETEVMKLNDELELRVEKRTRELEDMNRELEAFSYSVSHDLRAPLRHMSGFATILEEEYAANLPVDAKRYVRRVRNAAAHMSELVDGLLKLAHVGRQVPNLQRCSLESILAAARAVLELTVSERRVAWVVGTLPDVQGDRTLLEQVFANLLSNALKFTRGRSPALIEISARQSQGMVLVSVRDNGAGFDPQHAAKLFGVFQRLHRQDEFEGTGVGLATVQRIVQKHGGRIWADSEPGQGATFYFTLPEAEPALAEATLAAGAPA